MHIIPSMRDRLLASFRNMFIEVLLTSSVDCPGPGRLSTSSGKLRAKVLRPVLAKRIIQQQETLHECGDKLQEILNCILCYPAEYLYDPEILLDHFIHIGNVSHCCNADAASHYQVRVHLFRG